MEPLLPYVLHVPGFVPLQAQASHAAAHIVAPLVCFRNQFMFFRGLGINGMRNAPRLTWLPTPCVSWNGLSLECYPTDIFRLELLAR